LRTIIAEAAFFLKQSGIEQPYKTAELILAYVLNEPVVNLYLYDNRIISAKDLRLFYRFVRERAAFIPLQYLTKRVYFYGYDFFIKKGVFIPRPETEILVEEVITLYKDYFSPRVVKILDIGTGIGNISVTLGKEIEGSRITATDVSQKALDVAVLNARLHKVDGKIMFKRCRCFPKDGEKFHIIVSNPPYIPTDDMPFLPEEVKQEPVKALYGGRYGLDVIRNIMGNSDRFLVKGGYLLLEIGQGQARLLKTLACNLKLIAIKKDLAGIERYPIFKRDDYG